MYRYFVPALSGLYAPHWRDDARGCIVGLTRFANKRHVVRAGLEAVCFQTQEVYHAMCVDAKSAELDMSGAALRVDGYIHSYDGKYDQLHTKLKEKHGAAPKELLEDTITKGEARKAIVLLPAVGRLLACMVSA